VAARHNVGKIVQTSLDSSGMQSLSACFPACSSSVMRRDASEPATASPTLAKLGLMESFGATRGLDSTKIMTDTPNSGLLVGSRHG